MREKRRIIEEVTVVYDDVAELGMHRFDMIGRGFKDYQPVGRDLPLLTRVYQREIIEHEADKNASSVSGG